MNIIPQKDLDKGYKCPVHVECWNKATVFMHVSTSPEGEHTIKTQKSKRVYKTKNNLLYTKRNQPPKK
jgi:hypothetical protein